MKFFSILIIIAFVALLACRKEEAEPVEAGHTLIAPTVKVLNEESTELDKLRLMAGSEFQIFITAKKGNSPMLYYSLKLNESIYKGISGKVPETDSFLLKIENIKVPDTKGNYEFTIEIEDESNQTASFSWTVESIHQEDYFPKIKIINTDSTVASDTVINYADNLKIWVDAKMGAKNIEKYKIFTYSFSGFTPFQPNYTFPVENTNGSFLKYIEIELPKDKYTFFAQIVVYDIEGNWNDTTFTITKNLEFLDPVIATLGAQSNPNNSQIGQGPFFNISENKVYNLNNFSSGNNVDIVYFYSDTFSSVLYGSGDIELRNNSSYNSSTWNVTKYTKVAKATFNVDTLSANYFSETGISYNSPILSLNEGDYFFVMAGNNNRSILKILEIVPGPQGFIKIENKKLRND